MRKLVTMRTALESPDYFGQVLTGESWAAWRVIMLAIMGEVGLSGEVRSVGQLNARLNEASKLGFERCILPKTSRPIENPPKGLRLIPTRSLGEALDAALGK